MIRSGGLSLTDEAKPTHALAEDARWAAHARCFTSIRDLNRNEPGPLGLPDTRAGSFTQALYDEAKKHGWIMISIKDDRKRIFAFET